MHKEEVIRSFTESFRDGEILLPYVKDPIDGSYYRYDVAYNDGSRTFEKSFTATYYEYVYDVSEGDRYELHTHRADSSVTTMPTGSYVPGESARFAVYNNGKELKENLRTLFVVMTPDGISSVVVAEDNATSVTFAGEVIPYARVAAVVSDGRNSVASLTAEMAYDFARLNQLTVTVDAAADKALPGESVGVTVTVTDPDGKPVP